MNQNKKSILITGCSSGIGLCVAQALQQRGYRVFATARKKDDVKKLIALGLESFQLDLDDSTSIKSAFNAIIEKTNGTLDALFNNGAYGQAGAVEDLSRDVLRQQFETNVFGWHELTNLALPVMLKQGHGRIIQNSSVLGIIALKLRGAYTASKYAIEGLSDTLRQELMGTNIYVSLIEPGPIESQFRANSFAAYKKNIDKENSRFKTEYEATEK
ncbi:MAG: SDR family NAD(P)-dependent oxidoreductase, partial [Gammaproteobacteria bacterium]|nr:SDR family NAD(P)-dependent oxidoreductase [Gammaproteobacteria bacterium]